VWLVVGKIVVLALEARGPVICARLMWVFVVVVASLPVVAVASNPHCKKASIRAVQLKLL
jgi:hypothetical protein